MTVTATDQSTTSPYDPSPPEIVAPKRPSKAMAALAAAVTAIVLAALVYSIVEMANEHGTIASMRSQQDLRASALSAANSYGVELSSYDYTNLDGPLSSWTLVDQNSTPSFRHDFDSTKQNLSRLITDYKATASGKVLDAAVQSASATQAVVLLFVDQTVTNSAEKPGTQTQPLRVVLTMVWQHGKWLIDSVQAS